METGVRKEKGFVWESCSLDDDYRVYGGGDSLDDCEGMSAGGEYHKNGQLLVGGVTLFKMKEHPVRILDSK